jgi:AcrR family transcriptional regulator
MQVPDEPLKHRLLLAAERVVAQSGFAGATLREIHRVAKARNASAVHYHFGSLGGLLAEVFKLRSGPLVFESSENDLTVEDVVSTLVRALAAFLEPRPEGNYYLRFLERAVLEYHLARTFVPPVLMDNWDKAERILRRILLRDMAAELVEIRITFSRSHFVSGLAQIEAWIDSDASKAALLPLLTQALIDSTVAIITAPVSAAIARRIEELHRRDDSNLHIFE